MKLIRNIRILRNNRFQEANILVSNDGKIIKIFRSSKGLNYFFSKVDQVYLGRNLILLPGFIDMHVHFREPGETFKEDFETGSKAAVAGGFVIVADMPNNKPEINSFELFSKKIELVSKKSYVDFLLYVSVPTVNELNMFMKSRVKPSGIKIYFYRKRDAEFFLHEELISELLYIIHAEDGELLREAKDCESFKAFTRARPREAEISAIKKIISRLSSWEKNVYKQKRKPKIHITHLSTMEGLILLTEARHKGLKITIDVTPHHLLLNETDGSKLGTWAKCYPPLRTKKDNNYLLYGLFTGKIDAIASDHAPHTIEEKSKSLCEAPGGIASIQYVFPLLYTRIKKSSYENFPTLIRALSQNPARILGLDKRGSLRVGNFADFVLFDNKCKWRIGEEYNFSKCKKTPYDGRTVLGKIISTFIRGELVYSDGVFLRKIGRYATKIKQSH
ncbi:MAG: dihydroorotase family protein [Candidatus Njordarchaeum guaymaensis]